MMMNNSGVMGQPISIPSSSVQGQPPMAPTGPTQMIPAAGVPINPTMSTQARQAQNDEILSRCLGCTQRLRESLEVLLNITKQAASTETEDSLASAASSNPSAPAAPPSAGNPSSNPMNNNFKQTIDAKLHDMSQAIDTLGQSLEQYDFKMFLNQQAAINHYNELSFEKQGTLIDEWSSNTKWMNKVAEIVPSLHQSSLLYRRSNARYLNSINRLRADGSSSASIDKIIAQVEQSLALVSSSQQQASSQSSIPVKDYSLTSQRLSDHLTIVEFSLLRSGLDVFLHLRHCIVEHVTIKPLNEKKQFGNYFHSKFSSNYQALKIIAGHIRAAAVYFASLNGQPDQTLQKLLLYISKYNMLHSQKCYACQKHLLNGLQPTWRDFKNNECYHEECLN